MLGIYKGESKREQDVLITEVIVNKLITYSVYNYEGFAHGFCVISDTAIITYYCTNTYSPENERGFRWDDPEIKINWSISSPVISERDSKFPLFKDCDNNFTYHE